MDKDYIGETDENYKAECHWRKRIERRLLECVPIDQRELAMKTLEERTPDQLRHIVASCLAEGKMPHSDMPYTRIDDPIIEDAGLSFEARGLYMLLSSYAPWPKRTCYPSLDTLAAKGGTTRKRVIKCRDELVKRGHVAYTAGKGRQSNTYYLLHRDELAEAEHQRRAQRLANRSRKKEAA